MDRRRSLCVAALCRRRPGELDGCQRRNGRHRAFVRHFGPASSRLAFLRIDDTPVSTYITLDDISYDPKVETWLYPRAGDPNPKATLGVVRASGSDLEWVDLSKYEGTEFLIVRVAWNPAN